MTRAEWAGVELGVEDFELPSAWEQDGRLMRQQQQQRRRRQLKAAHRPDYVAQPLEKVAVVLERVVAERSKKDFELASDLVCRKNDETNRETTSNVVVAIAKAVKTQVGSAAPKRNLDSCSDILPALKARFENNAIEPFVLPAALIDTYFKPSIPKYRAIRKNRYRCEKNKLSPYEPCFCTSMDTCGDDCFNRSLNLSCLPDSCAAGAFCTNQPFSQPPHAGLVPIPVGSRGWGLHCNERIEEGAFVVEYVGEVIDLKEYELRTQSMMNQKLLHTYMLTLVSNQLYIDARHYANVARFINHSCEPNCVFQKWRVGDEYRIGVFALKTIEPHTEITVDYGFHRMRNRFNLVHKECLCGSQSCRSYLGPDPTHQSDQRSKANEADDECLICLDGGDLLLCDYVDTSGPCRKVYHMECLDISSANMPSGNQPWYCPRHECCVCRKSSQKRCTLCVNAWCNRHAPASMDNVESICPDCQENPHTPEPWGFWRALLNHSEPEKVIDFKIPRDYLELRSSNKNQK